MSDENKIKKVANVDKSRSEKIKGRIKFLKRFGFKTFYFNLKYLPFREAIKLPFFLSKNVYLRNVSGRIVLDYPVKRGQIKIGFGDVGLFDDKVSRTIWDVSGTVVFKGKIDIGHGSKIIVGKDGCLTIGDNFRITAESSIIAYSKISIGKDCLFSWNIHVMDTDFHIIKDETGEVINAPKPIIIGDNVWICSECLILKGANIPNKCIIGANSFVNKPLDNAGSIYAGNPVKCIKTNCTWEY